MSARLRRALPALTVLLLAPRAALACAVCFDLADRAREAYYGTTILLILLPFGILGGLVFWLRRAARRHAESQRDLRAPGEARRA